MSLRIALRASQVLCASALLLPIKPAVAQDRTIADLDCAVREAPSDLGVSLVDDVLHDAGRGGAEFDPRLPVLALAQNCAAEAQIDNTTARAFVHFAVSRLIAGELRERLLATGIPMDEVDEQLGIRWEDGTFAHPQMSELHSDYLAELSFESPDPALTAFMLGAYFDAVHNGRAAVAELVLLD